MSTNTKRFELSALSAVIIASCQSLGAIAQTESETPQNGSQPPVLEEVVVTGISGAIQKSIDDKRNAQQIMDTINAEDIGKNTDQNIADALGRVTGVSIVSRNGEGSQVSVRGTSPNQNNISINGQQLTSTDFNQAVDLSSYSSDILSKLEVIKTPSADHDEGSLGASINLVTVRPLDQPKPVRSGTLQGRYNDESEETDYKLQVSFSDVFLDDSLGLAFTLYDESNTTRRDQYRIENFRASDTLDVSRDQNGDIISDVRAIEHTQTIYEQIKNTNDRRGGTLGIQWAASEDTELMFNGTYTTQEETTVNNGFLTRRDPRTRNFVQGEQSVDLRPPAPFTDPQQDWYTIDTRNNTFIKQLNRYGVGDVVSSRDGEDKENISATLDLTHNINESFRVAAKLGYSKSTSESQPNAYAVLQNFSEVPVQLLYDAGEDIQITGYDCSSGRCNIVSGTHMVDLGELIDDDGATLGWEDNTALTGYNPTDILSQNLSFLSEDSTDVQDELKNFQLDFDWDVDAFGFTTIEFGGKVTTREKFVDDQRFLFNSITKTDVVEDENGNPIASPGGALRTVRGIHAATDFEYSGFMDALGYDAPNAENWVPFDAITAKNLVLDDANTIRTPDNTRTRYTDIDTNALYLKGNFSFLDDRLTGDIGVRYVETDIEANGFGGVDFWQFSETLQREFDRVHMRDLRNTALPECRTPTYATPGGDFGLGYEEKFQRVDGTGYDTSSGPDPSGWTPIADQGACHDPDYAAWAAWQANPDVVADPELIMNWYTMWRYADVSTVRDGGFVSTGQTPPPIAYDDSVDVGGFDTNAHSFIDPVNKELKSFATKNTHSYSNILPSLNVNFAVTDEVITRFAASKTMTRPEIDLLRSGFNIFEDGYWGGGSPTVGRFEQFNTKLEPLESNNLDISVEWYFSESGTGVLSAALFHKDMSNFTDIESAQVYSDDLRTLDATVSPEDLVRLPENDGTDDWGLAGCQPLRATADTVWNSADPTYLSNDLRDLCLQYNYQKVINGDGAKVSGIEFGYTQSYDFLPGYFLGGLGASVNYTYQDSEYDAQESTINPGQILPTYPVADTPEHTYNFTGFWQQDGHQLRLSYRGTSDSLVGTDYNTNLRGRTFYEGSLWNEGRDQLDLSATYAFNDRINLTFQAVNLTDSAFRTYFTSRTLEVDRFYNEDTGAFDFRAWDEGNPLDGEASKSRTYTEFKTGISYRLSISARF